MQYLQFGASQARGLVINDVSVLPHTLDDPSPVSIAAYQMSLDDGEVAAEQPLDFALERLEPITSPKAEGVMMIPVRFTVLAIAGSPVKTDTVLLRLLGSENELVLLDTKLLPFGETPGADACDGKEGWSMCRIKAMVMARVKGMMEKLTEGNDAAKGWVNGGCGGRFVGHGGPKGFGWMGGRRPGPHHHHHQGHRHWRSQRFHKALHRTIKFFFIPALLGIIGGMMASAVGMLVGQILVYLWQHFYRRSQRAQARPKVLEIVVRDVDKTALMEYEDKEDAPPMYQDIEAAVPEEKQ